MAKARKFDVTFVRHANGTTGPVPRFDQSWDKLTKLGWMASCIEARFPDVSIVVTDDATQRKRLGRWVPVPDTFGISVASWSTAPFSFDAAWTYLTGVDRGLEAAASAAKTRRSA